jgi:hypothetical protein
VRRRYMRSLGQGVTGILLAALWIGRRSRRSRNTTETVSVGLRNSSAPQSPPRPPHAQPRRWRQVVMRSDPTIAALAKVAALALALLVIVKAPPVYLTISSVVLLLLAGCLFVLPPIIAPSRAPGDLAGVDGLTSKDRIQFADDRRKLQNDVRGSVLQALVGGALLVGLLFTWQQQRTTTRQLAQQSQQFAQQLDLFRHGQVGERFNRAVEQLGADNQDVRLGGIYELEQLARQAADRRLVIFEVVSAYIRQHPPGRPTQPTTSTASLPGTTLLTSSLRTRAPDVQAALTVLGRRQVLESDPTIELGGLDLAGADLAGANLALPGHGLR